MIDEVIAMGLGHSFIAIKTAMVEVISGRHVSEIQKISITKKSR